MASPLPHGPVDGNQRGPNGAAVAKLPSCGNCRARKVKCDRRQPGCVRCSKLDLPCSYSTSPGEVVPDLHPDVGGTTEAGLKRRRTRAACRNCRSVKSKCSGSNPCSRCNSLRLDCVYGEGLRRNVRGSRGTENAQDATVSLLSPSSFSRHDTEPATHQHQSPCTIPSDQPPPREVRASHGDISLHSRTLQRRSIDAFFAQEDSADCVFLHKASILSKWSRGLVHPDLLQALCATGLRNLSDEYSEPGSLPFTWIRDVQHSLLRLNGFREASLGALQALVLVIRFHYRSDFNPDASILLPLAARIAFVMHLNHEKPAATGPKADPDSFQRELQRRLMWAIFMLDKIFSGGIEDLTVCPTSRMKIRLPCTSATFQRGIVSTSAFLHRPERSATGSQPATEHMDAVAYRMQLFDLRDRILRYTRAVILERSNPVQSEAQLKALDDELHHFRDQMPSELQLSPVRLTFMTHSEDAAAYIVLHTMWLLCRCDLHRFLIPGIRESVSPDVFAQVPRSYIDRCQRVCFDSAVRMCDLWSEVYDLDSQMQFKSSYMAIAIYQCAQTLTNLAFLMPTSGPHCVDALRQRLSKATTMISHLGKMHLWLRTCIADIGHLTTSLGHNPQRSRRNSGQNFHNSPHARSKHSYVRLPAQEREGNEPEAAETTCMRSGLRRRVEPTASPTPAWPSQPGASTAPLHEQAADNNHNEPARSDNPTARNEHIESIPNAWPTPQTSDWFADGRNGWLTSTSMPHGAAATLMAPPQYTIPLDPMELILNSYSSNDLLSWPPSYLPDGGGGEMS